MIITSAYLCLFVVVLASIAVVIWAMIRPSGKAIALIAVMSLFLVAEWASAQNDTVRLVFQVLEAVVIVLMGFYAVLERKRLANTFVPRVIPILLCLVICNLFACLWAYEDALVFAWSTYDCCKYFVVIFYVASLGLSTRDLRCVASFISLLVFVNFFLAAAQFAGIESLFDPFRGRFDIYIRSGLYRAIGFFPYPIELGNWATMMFALLYGMNKRIFHSRALFLPCTLCILLTVLSGTRTAMIAILALYVISNIGTMRNWGKTIAVVSVAIMIFASFFPIDQLLDRFSSDLSSEQARQYYLSKGLQVWLDYPVFGIGYGTYGTSRYRILTNDLIFDRYGIHQFDYADLASTDSFISEMIPEYGIAGLCLIASLLLLLFRAARNQKNSAGAFTLSLFAGFILAINSSSALFSPHVGFYWWLAAGSLLSDWCRESATDLPSQSALCATRPSRFNPSMRGDNA